MIKNYIKKILDIHNKPQIFIISYPKAGRTWLRALIGYYLSTVNNLQEEKIFDTEYIFSSSGLPKIKIIHDGSSLNDKRFNTQLDYDKSKYQNKKVLLLGRNVKDLAVSSFFQATNRNFTFNLPISQFIRSEQFGIMKILTFYNQWYDNRHVPKKFIFIRYEEMHKCPDIVLGRVLKFLGVNKINTGLIDYAIDCSQFDNLKKLEVKNRFNLKILSPRNINDNESYKIRKGKIGNYAEYLNTEDIDYINGLIKKYGCDFTKKGEDI